MPSWVSRPHTQCRVCSAPLQKPYLDLGEQPLANALVKQPFAEDVGSYLRPEQRFPLQVILCEQCGLSQLSVVVNPEILYAGYRFRSGQSEAWVKHCVDLAARCGDGLQEGGRLRVLDIAANDGTQIKAFRGMGWHVVGIDPSPADESVVKATWPEAAVYYPIPTFDLVIAQNVLGHVDDPIAFLKAIKTVLAPEGRVIVEVPQIGYLIDSRAFDTIYHEHLSYWCTYALRWAARRAGLDIAHSEKLPTVHGGSKRYWLAHCPPLRHRPTAPIASRELNRDRYSSFAQRVGANMVALANIVNGPADPDTYKWLGWGASAKAAVYLNEADRVLHIPTVLSAIIDDCVEKQGLLMPGVHIPVIACPESLEDVDVIWVLSWNNYDSIANKARSRGFKGRFLLTHPTPRLIDA